MLRNILKWAGLMILFLLAGVKAVTALRQHVTYEVSFPDIQASTDSAIIAKGHDMVMDPGYFLDYRSTAPNKSREAVFFLVKGAFLICV
jgi:hypothetical protein